MSGAKKLTRFEPKGTIPRLRLHGFRLDYNAALAAIARGGCAAQVAIAAGSRASSRRNLRRVGLKIVDRLVGSEAVWDTFDRLGFTLRDFCRCVSKAVRATKKTYLRRKGREVAVFEDPDWRTRAKAGDQYARSIGLYRWPQYPEDRVLRVVESRPDEDWELLASLSYDELACLFELARKRRPQDAATSDLGSGRTLEACPAGSPARGQR